MDRRLINWLIFLTWVDLVLFRSRHRIWTVLHIIRITLTYLKLRDTVLVVLLPLEFINQVCCVRELISFILRNLLSADRLLIMWFVSLRFNFMVGTRPDLQICTVNLYLTRLKLSFWTNFWRLLWRVPKWISFILIWKIWSFFHWS